MEKQIALINKTTKRVVNVLIVDSIDKDYIKQFSTDELDVVVVKDSIPHIYGLWNGKEFSEPTESYLIEIGLIQPIDQKEKAEADAKAAEKQALLDRLGITADEAKLLLG
jgi:hypothetical protein